MSVQILTGDVHAMLATLPEESVHCVVTSPPYWGLRCYGVEGQIGQEPTLGEHIEVIVEVFREVRRVLRKDGTVWLNYGDCYANDGKWGGSSGGKHVESLHGQTGVGRQKVTTGLKPKDLCMMPARVALALQADGWWLRSEIIWHKPNPMPESVTDRPTSSHEKIYLLVRSERYYFDADAVREAEAVPDWDDGTRVFGGKNKHGANIQHGSRTTGRVAGARKRGLPPRHSQYESSDRSGLDNVGRGSGRNIRNVWTVATAPFSSAHFATFPPALIEPCIKAGTSEKGCCPECGAPWTRIVSVTRSPDRENRVQDRAGDSLSEAHGEDGRSGNRYTTSSTTIGWQPVCGCDLVDPVPCTLLDPFGGAGTTGLVADRLKRNAILIELNPEYAAMAKARIQADGGMFAEVGAP